MTSVWTFWKNFGFIMVHWSYVGLTLSISDVLNRAPLLPQIFDQFLILTDNGRSIRKTELQELRESGVTIWVPPREAFIDCNLYSTRTAVLVSYQHLNSLKAIINNTTNIMRIAPFVLILCANDTEDMSMVDQLATFFRLDSNVYWVCRKENMLILSEIYSLKGQNFAHIIGPVELNERMLMELTQQKWQRRRNFERIAVIATAADDEAYNDEVKFNDNQTILESGVAVDIFKVFQDYLNFSEMAIVGDYVVDYTDDDLVATPMQIQLAEGIADISITLSSVGEFKGQVAQLLHAFPSSWLVAHFPADNDNNDRSKKAFFSGPFSIGVWITTFFSTLVILIGLKLIRRVAGPYVIDNDCNADVLCMLSFLCVKALPYWSSRNSIRVLLFTSSVMGFLLYSGFSSTLISQLSVRFLPAVTLHQLVRHNFQLLLEIEVELPAYDNDGSNDWTDVTTIAIMREWQDFSPIVNGANRKNLAAVTYPEFFYFAMAKHNLTTREVCEAYSNIRVSNRPSPFVMLVSKGSEFREVFNFLIVKVMERSVSRRLFKKYKRVLSNCGNDPKGHVQQTMGELSLAFLVLLAGALSALLLLIAECTLKNSMLVKWPKSYHSGSSVASQHAEAVVTFSVSAQKH